MNEARNWDPLARRYDVAIRLFDRSYPEIRRRLRHDLADKARVLEVSAGTGQFTLDIAAAAGQVVATDIAPQMVAALQQRLNKESPGNVGAAVMSAYEIDVEDETFDAVFCANGLHVMETPERALGEFRRILKGDGILIAPTFLHGADRWRRALSRSLSLVSSFVAHTRFDLAGLKYLLESAGFTTDQCDQLPGVFPVGYVVAHPSRNDARR